MRDLKKWIESEQSACCGGKCSRPCQEGSNSFLLGKSIKKLSSSKSDPGASGGRDETGQLSAEFWRLGFTATVHLRTFSPRLALDDFSTPIWFFVPFLRFCSCFLFYCRHKCTTTASIHCYYDYYFYLTSTSRQSLVWRCNHLTVTLTTDDIVTQHTYTHTHTHTVATTDTKK